LIGAALLVIVAVATAPKDTTVDVITFSPEGYGLVALSNSATSVAAATTAHEIQIWDWGPSGFGKKPRARRPMNNSTNAITLSANGSILAAATADEVRVMRTRSADLPDAYPPIRHTYAISLLTLDHDGRTMFFADIKKQLFVYDLPSGKRERCVTTETGSKRAMVNTWDAVPIWLSQHGAVESITHEGAVAYSRDPKYTATAKCAKTTITGIKTGDGRLSLGPSLRGVQGVGRK